MYRNLLGNLEFLRSPFCKISQISTAMFSLSENAKKVNQTTYEGEDYAVDVRQHSLDIKYRNRFRKVAKI